MTALPSPPSYIAISMKNDEGRRIRGSVYPPPTRGLPHLVMILTDRGMIASISTAQTLTKENALLRRPPLRWTGPTS